MGFPRNDLVDAIIYEDGSNVSGELVRIQCNVPFLPETGESFRCSSACLELGSRERSINMHSRKLNRLSLKTTLLFNSTSFSDYIFSSVLSE